jgi:hypothetical protein
MFCLFEGDAPHGALVFRNVHGPAGVIPSVFVDQLFDHQSTKAERRSIAAQLHVTQFFELGAIVMHREVIAAVEHGTYFIG